MCPKFRTVISKLAVQLGCLHQKTEISRNIWQILLKTLVSGWYPACYNQNILRLSHGLNPSVVSEVFTWHHWGHSQDPKNPRCLSRRHPLAAKKTWIRLIYCPGLGHFRCLNVNLLCFSAEVSWTIPSMESKCVCKTWHSFGKPSRRLFSRWKSVCVFSKVVKNCCFTWFSMSGRNFSKRSSFWVCLNL